MTIAATLLDWYRTHARVLPWRTPPGSNTQPDPYCVWLSEVMLQQTTVATVTPRYAAFLARWPTVEVLAAAPDADVMQQWAGLGYYARARNLLACARAVVRDHQGAFPDEEDRLRTLPGVGAYTAAAIAAIAFGRRAVVVDGNVARVVARLFAMEQPIKISAPKLARLTDTITPDRGAGDFAQAMMDLANGICTPRAPDCSACPLAESCKGFASGNPQSYPPRPTKAPKPERDGTVWWITCDGDVLMVRRPDKGLLGGMMALPTLGWDNEDTRPPVSNGARWPQNVTHVFTHFRLTLSIMVTTLEKRCKTPPGAQWWAISHIDAAGLPTVFKKVARAVLGEDE